MFRGEKMAKVMGSLASKRSAEEGEEMSGILVKRNFNYHILSPEVMTKDDRRIRNCTVAIVT